MRGASSGGWGGVILKTRVQRRPPGLSEHKQGRQEV